MTYRHPFDRKKRPDEMTRPPLPNWINKGLAEYESKTKEQKHTIDYWHQMYWATPAWLTDKQIQKMKDIYNERIPGLHHIDHIVPLNSPLVCGLNVPWNMVRMEAKENQKKSNITWPGHPFEHLYNPPGLFDILPGAHQMALI